MPQPTLIPQITATAATPPAGADACGTTYFHTPVSSNEEGKQSLDSLDHNEQLLPNQRRAIDSQDLSQGTLASSNLHLAFSDPMLAITQLPNAGRRTSIASSLHSNISVGSANRRHHLGQTQYYDEKTRSRVSINDTGLPMEKNQETFATPDFPEVDDGSPPMDTSWYGYVVAVSSFIIYFIVFGIEHTFGVYQEFYSSQLAEPFLHNSSPQDIAMIGTLGTTVTYLLGAFSGRFADRAGYRVSAVLGAFFMGAGLICASFAKSLPALYICQGVVLGIGSSLVYLPAVSCPAHWFEKYRSMAIGIVVCGSGLGGLVLGPLTEHLITSVGVHWTLRIQGILCLVGIGGSGMLLKTRVRKVPGQNKKIPMDFTICKEVPFVTLTLANFLTSLGYMIPFFFLSTFAVFRGETPTTGALMIGILNGASLVGRITLGFVTDRVGRINMLFGCAFVSGMSILCIWSFATNLKILTVFAIVYGFTCGGYFAVIPSVIAEIYGLDRLTTVTGLLYGSIGFGYLIGSPVSGFLLDITKPYTNYIYLIIFSGSTMTLSSLAVLYLKYWRSQGRWWSHI